MPVLKLWRLRSAVGVKHMAPREPPSGPLAFLYRAQDSLKSSASTLMMTVYLLAMRECRLWDPNHMACTVSSCWLR